MLSALLLIVGGYLLGSLASAVLVCRLLGLPDPRHGGSGNPGATNVLRLGGKRAAAITLAGDLLKGLLPVLLARGLGQPDTVLGAVAVAAFLGHLYPVFFGFKGGKGVATALGAVAGLSALALAGMALTWLLVAGIWRYSSLAALVATLFAPVFVWLATASAPLLLATAVISIFVFVRHRGNLARLRAGTEPRIGGAASAASDPPEGTG